MIEHLSKLFCGGNRVSCQALIDNPAFQMVVTPMSALWNNQNTKELAKTLCFSPKYSPAFEFESVSNDGSLTSKYKNFLFKLPQKDNKHAEDVKQAAMKFLKFEHTFVKGHSHMCMPWEEVGMKLEDWKNVQMKNFDATKDLKPGNQPFHFHFDVDFTTSQSNLWSDFGVKYRGKEDFIRAVVESEEKPKDDHEKTISANGASSDWFFRKRAVFKQRLQLIKSNRFDFTFGAQSVGIVTVKPSGSWYDENVVQRFKSNFRNHSQFVPKYLFVAINPKVTITVSKQVYEEFEKMMKKIKGRWYVAGVHFGSNPAFTYSDENFKEDENIQNDYIVLRRPKKMNTTPKSDFIFVRDEYIVGGFTPAVENDYQIDFVSRSGEPQILGVVSSII